MRNKRIWKRLMAWTLVFAMTAGSGSFAALAEEVQTEPQTAVTAEEQTDAQAAEEQTETEQAAEEKTQENQQTAGSEDVAGGQTEEKTTEAQTTGDAGNAGGQTEEKTTETQTVENAEAAVELNEDPSEESEHKCNLTHVEAKAATCTEAGNSEYWVCDGDGGCGKYFEDENGNEEITDKEKVIIAKKAHTLTAFPEKSATCTEGGNKAYWYCSECKNYFSDENGETLVNLSDMIISAGHTLTAVAEKAATCTEDGNKAYWHCSVCDKYFEDEKCEKEITLEDTVIKAGHKLTAVAAKEATSTEEGNTAYWYCSECKKYFSDEKAEKETTKEAVTISVLPMSAAEIAVNSVALNNKMKVVWSGSKLKATWGAVDYADGYEIYGKKRGGGALGDADLILTVGSGAATSAVISQIAGGAPVTTNNYKFVIKAYRMVDGKKEYIATGLVVHVAGKNSAKYTNVAKLKADASGYTMAVGETRLISLTVTKKQTSKKLLPKKSIARRRYLTTNASVATVSSAGVVTAVGQGTCYVYIKAANGRQTKIKITVY